jgi:hypothetical protein
MKSTPDHGLIESTRESSLSSARAFFTELIDYAGLFPPAKQSLPEALRDYRSFRRSPYNWILGRFIAPLSQVEALSQLLPHDSPQLALSVIGTTATSDLSPTETILLDLDAIATFNTTYKGRIAIEVYETPLPQPEKMAADWTHKVSAHIEKLGIAHLSLFFETPLKESNSSGLQHLIKQLSNHAKEKTATPIGLKLRCGGVTSDAFPTAKTLAHCLATCAQQGVPIKCTAGLHHPLHHTDEQLEAEPHGFVNLFGGAMLAIHHKLTEEQILDILKERDHVGFTFNEAGFKWRDLSLSHENIAHLRDDRVLSFGSCSFSEPLEDLLNLNWIQ